MLARDPLSEASPVRAGEPLAARVTLNDGRVLALRSSMRRPRPQATLIARSLQRPRGDEGATIRIDGDTELPQGATLAFSLRAAAPTVFGPNARVEIASVDGAFATTLTVARNQLKLAGPGVAVAQLDPAMAFGPAAFGPLQFRLVVDEVDGDWTPLATLIRVPELVALKCAAATESTCSLSGSDLYLIESVGRGPRFEDAVDVPEGFPGQVLLVPYPGDEGLAVKLRDNPSVIHPVELEVQLAAGGGPGG
jgi:hypothetical protein